MRPAPESVSIHWLPAADERSSAGVDRARREFAAYLLKAPTNPRAIFSEAGAIALRHHMPIDQILAGLIAQRAEA
jgi:hypothetical protein